ncbi:unnamed protein product, partial [Nesidiocoris tenuis]
MKHYPKLRYHDQLPSPTKYEHVLEGAQMECLRSASLSIRVSPLAAVTADLGTCTRH